MPPSRAAVSAPSEKKRRFHESWTFLIIVCIGVPVLFRSFFFAPFHIPSGSMKPTLLIGDFIFVSKSAYGYSRFSFPLGLNLFEGRAGGDEPKRGDIVVFRPPTNNRTDFIKRLIGLPGDRIQMIRSELYINGTRVKRQRSGSFWDTDEDTGQKRELAQYTETLPNGVSYETLDDVANGSTDNTKVFTVPEGNYFFMGDNRDHSADSRTNVVGYVPAENLIGRARVIFFSTTGRLWKLWEWPQTLRRDRLLRTLPEGK